MALFLQTFSSLDMSQLPWIRHKVGLEFSEVDVECTVEPQRGRDGGHDLSDQPVQVCVRRPLHVQAPDDGKSFYRF